jgi:hypothetical protein
MHALRIHDGNIYLDGTRIEGVKKYSLDWEQDELPVDARGNIVAVHGRQRSET